MPKESLWMSVVEIVLGFVLVGGLVLAGWNVYRHLPGDGTPTISGKGNTSQNQTKVTVTLRGDVASAMLNSPVNFYPFDLVAAQREFQASPRLARQFDDFLMRRMHGITPVTATTDDKGREVAILNEGNWWLHAMAASAGGETIEWRLPVNVAGAEQTVELTIDNAYERTKKF